MDDDDFDDDDLDVDDDDDDDDLDSVSVVSRVRQFNARVSMVLTYNKAKALLTVRLKGTTDVPGRGQGGADAYQATASMTGTLKEKNVLQLVTIVIETTASALEELTLVGGGCLGLRLAICHLYHT
ncbi:unnamed protein product [Echinostoma caproni]|uniref:Uncharacterized protein n=1 Tax=Echinostoma caproni TaxID=27848 RepID=A0A3P8H593_9TREM|nr:unnamed protein product [Echinostoma caproni]